jgi:hypothetical protein
MIATRLAILIMCAVTAGCSGPFVKVAPIPAAGATVGERVKGSSCGFLLFDLIPIGINERTKNAYDKALRSAGAGTQGLADTDVTTKWFYVYLGSIYCTTVEGNAVR